MNDFTSHAIYQTPVYTNQELILRHKNADVKSFILLFLIGIYI